jgi:hypothetical protein
MRKSFDENIYTSLSLTKLTIFAISKIAENSEECAYERVIKECFTLFPKRFSLQRYPQWPDGARIKIEILRCRDNGWLTGNEKTAFQLTSIGKRAAEEVLKELRGGVAKKLGPGPKRDRGDTIIRYLKQSDPFQRFQKNRETFHVDEVEFRKLLVTTFEAPARVLKENLNYCIDICTQYGEKKLCEFLEASKNQNEHLLKTYKYKRSKRYGGNGK